MRINMKISVDAHRQGTRSVANSTDRPRSISTIQLVIAAIVIMLVLSDHTGETSPLIEMLSKL
jgi:hypothetical protein